MANPALTNPNNSPLGELLVATFVLLIRSGVYVTRGVVDALTPVVVEQKRIFEESLRQAQAAQSIGNGVHVKPNFPCRRFALLYAMLSSTAPKSHVETPEPVPLPKQPVPHRDLWYRDGNIILSSDRHVFRVYKGVLARQSSVFRDMFKLPGVPTSVEDASPESELVTDKDHWKGIPIVHMVGDTDHDVTIILMALMNRSFFKKHEKMTVSTIISLLGMCTKYDFYAIGRDAISYLAQAFPGDLCAFSQSSELDFFTGYSSKDGDDFRLLAAALTHGARLSMPALFYLCARKTHGEIVTQGKRFLSDEEAQLVLHGRKAAAAFIEKLRRRRRAVSSQTSSSAPPVPSFCPSQNRNQPYLSCVYEAPLPERALCGPLEQTLQNSMYEETTELKAYCATCRTAARRQNVKDKRDMWEALPSFFRLPGWKALEYSWDKSK